MSTKGDHAHKGKLTEEIADAVRLAAELEEPLRDLHETNSPRSVGRPNASVEKHTAKNRSPLSDPDRLGQELTALCGLSLRQLKDRWRSLYGSEPPSAISRELLTRAIAHRLQERALGGLKPSTRRLLERIAEGHPSRPMSSGRTAPGMVLIREWQGRSHRVAVLDDGGIVYDGKRYRSLSEVARVITGARWSGPLFFGLRGRTREAQNG
jgi:hypothetical protein